MILRTVFWSIKTCALFGSTLPVEFHFQGKSLGYVLYAGAPWSTEIALIFYFFLIASGSCKLKLSWKGIVNCVACALCKWYAVNITWYEHKMLSKSLLLLLNLHQDAEQFFIIIIKSLWSLSSLLFFIIIRLSSRETVDSWNYVLQMVRRQHKLEWDAALHLTSDRLMEVLDPPLPCHFFQQTCMDVRNFFLIICAVDQRASQISWSPGHCGDSWHEH